ncbi:MAG TPA: CHAT domain-containing protein [Puia sp.]|nr:CHAT domain-containing protein [Puia sp.]
MRVSNCKHSILRRATILLCACLLLISFRPPGRWLDGGPDRPNEGPGGNTPPELEHQLKQLHDKDDLTGWIYLQIQWVAKSPISRSALLQQAVRQAWRPPATNEEIQAWQDLLINEGYALLISGDIVHSTDAYTAAFQWARQHADLADESLVLENILKPLGNNYTRLGDYEQALFIHRKALAVAHALNEPSALAGTFSNLANTASNMGRPAESLDYCRQGLALLKGTSPLRGLLLSEQADALMALDQQEAARQSIRQSIEILEKNSTAGAGHWLLTAYQQAGDIYEDQPDRSLSYYQTALRLEERLSGEQDAVHQRQKAKLFQHIGSLYARTRQPELATHWLDRCLSILIPGAPLDSLREKDLYAENTLMDLLYTSAGLAEEQGHTDKALRLYKLCFATEYALRRQFVTGSSRERSVSDSHLRYETAINAAWNAWKATGNPIYQQSMLGFMEDSKAKLLLDEVLQQQQLAGATDSLSNRIRLLEKALIYYRKEGRQQPDSLRQAMIRQEEQVEWDLAQLRKKVPVAEPPSQAEKLSLTEDQLVRSFFSGAHALYIIELDRNGIIYTDRIVLSEGWQDSLRTFIHTWFEKGPGNMINDPAGYYHQAYAIYRQLYGTHPFAAGKEYILLPDGALSLLPTDALVTAPVCPPSPAGWPFVIRQASVSYAWSMRTLQQQIHASGNGKGFSGFFLADAKQLPQLNNVTGEQEAMTRIIKNGKWYKDDKATTSAFRQALQQSAVVHISSHAFSGKDTGQIPHIALYDQPFYLFELKDLPQHPGLVVLSACRTGDGRMVTGEGVQSLARAFIAQGANAVVAGWWNVNDATAAQLMQRFYQSWITGQSWTTGRQPGIADALRSSKLDWLNDPQVAYQHKLPYYWAALNYAGNPAPLSKDVLESKADGLSGWMIGLIVLLIATVLFLAILRIRR